MGKMIKNRLVIDCSSSSGQEAEISDHITKSPKKNLPIIKPAAASPKHKKKTSRQQEGRHVQIQIQIVYWTRLHD